MDQRTKTPTQRNVDLKAIHQRLKGGHVLRYHAKPEIADGQNVAAHTWRAMVILQTLWPDSSKNAMIHRNLTTNRIRLCKQTRYRF